HRNRGPVASDLGVPEGGLGSGLERGERGLAVPVHAFGVGAVEGEAGEELGRHAAAAAGVEGPARGAGARALGLPQRGEELRVAPDRREASGVTYVAGEELAG